MDDTTVLGTVAIMAIEPGERRIERREIAATENVFERRYSAKQSTSGLANFPSLDRDQCQPDPDMERERIKEG
jgi:hypothetical protein